MIKMMTKSDLRKQIKKKLIDSQASLENFSQKICKIIINSDLYKKSQIILAYMALADEVNLAPLIQQAVNDEKQIFIPRISPNALQMDFFRYRPEKPFFINQYGIKEPEENGKKFEIKNPDDYRADDNILILTPGRAFSLNGARLGRGKGYYDRFFTKTLSTIPQQKQPQETKKITIAGVCFSLQIAENIPTESHDIKMDYLICEKGLKKI